MPLPNLLLPPDQASYAAAFGETSVSTQLQGGASRFRADQLGAAFKLDVQWTMSKKNYNYLTAFYRTTIKYGADPFTISLMIDSGAMQSYTAHFMPGTFALIQQMGETYVVGAKLEVVPDPSYSTGDAALVTAGPDV